MLPQSADVNTSFNANPSIFQRDPKKELVKSLKKELIGKVSPAANSIYCYLEFFGFQNFKKNNRNYVLTSAAHLAERLGIHLATAYDALRELKEKKLIVENKTQEFIAVRSEVSGKSLKLGRSFSVLPLGDQEIFQKQQLEGKKNLPMDLVKSEKLEAEGEKRKAEGEKNFAFGEKESSETVVKPSVSEGIYNKDIKYNKYNNPKEDFEKIYEKFPKRNEHENVTSALLEKFEEAKTELGLEKLQEHVERYAKEREGEETRYTSRFYTWLTERKWQKYDGESMQTSEKQLAPTTEWDIERGNDNQQVKELKKKILREIGCGHTFRAWFREVKFNFLEDGTLLVLAPNSFVQGKIEDLYARGCLRDALFSSPR